MATELSLDPQSRGSSFESPLASVKLQWKKTVERVLQRCLNLYVGLGYAPLVRSVTERNEQIERKAGNGGKPKYIKFSSPLHEKRVSRAATCKIAERYLKSPERILSRQKIVWDGDEISAYENAIAELEGTVEGGVPFISRFLEKNSLLLDRLKTGISSLSEYKDKRVILARDIKTRNLKLYLVNEKLELSEIEGAEDFFINISSFFIN